MIHDDFLVAKEILVKVKVKIWMIYMKMFDFQLLGDEWTAIFCTSLATNACLLVGFGATSMVKVVQVVEVL